MKTYLVRDEENIIKGDIMTDSESLCIVMKDRYLWFDNDDDTMGIEKPWIIGNKKQFCGSSELHRKAPK